MNRLTPEQHEKLLELAARNSDSPSIALLTAAAREVIRLRRALDAGARRHADRREVQELEQSRVESAAMDLAVELVEARRELAVDRKEIRGLHKDLRFLLSRNGKLEGKLVTRAAALGAERGVMAAVLDAKTKEADGLRASLAKQRARTDRQKQRADRLATKVAGLESRELGLRKKLRDSNKAVLVGQLGGGLEVQPMSGQPFEDTSGYSDAARRAAGGQL